MPHLNLPIMIPVLLDAIVEISVSSAVCRSVRGRFKREGMFRAKISV